jgi:hypothetical protein
MSLSDPKSWTATTLSVADMNTYVRDTFRWVIGHTSNPKPFGEVSLSTPQAISSTTLFVLIAFDTTVVDRGGGFSGGGFVAPVDGFYSFAGSASVAPSLGNKEIRLIVDADENNWFAADNRFGIATSAYCRLATAGQKWLTAGQSVDVGVFCDAPTSPNIEAAHFSWCWQATN